MSVCHHESLMEKYGKGGKLDLSKFKILGNGELSKKVDVAALNFSAGASKKISDANGQILTIKELLQKNPDGKNVRIVG